MWATARSCAEGDSEGADAVESTNSQSYLAHVAARAIILIGADDPVIGLVAFVAVGMDEVSSCKIDPNVSPGSHLAKGAELGYLQFGGSTHCLVFPSWRDRRLRPCRDTPAPPGETPAGSGTFPPSDSKSDLSAGHTPTLDFVHAPTGRGHEGASVGCGCQRIAAHPCYPSTA